MTTVVVEVLLRVEVRVHSTVEGSGSSFQWLATNSCKREERAGEENGETVKRKVKRNHGDGGEGGGSEMGKEEMSEEN